MRFCFNLLHYKHRDFLRADDLDYVSGPLGISGGKMILSVSNHKGGVGKTTVSTLLAAYTARHTDKKILLITTVDHHRYFSQTESPNTASLTRSNVMLKIRMIQFRFQVQ